MNRASKQQPSRNNVTRGTLSANFTVTKRDSSSDRNRLIKDIYRRSSSVSTKENRVPPKQGILQRSDGFFTSPGTPPAVAPRKETRIPVSSRHPSITEPPIPKPRSKTNNTSVLMTSKGPLLATPAVPVLNVIVENTVVQPQTFIANVNVHPSLPYSPGACGLKNLGNTCFMNSALQCLSHIPDLTDKAKDQYESLPKDSNDILYVYASLMRTMWSGKKQVADPHDIKRLVGRSFPIFADDGQKDAHEFMNSLLNLIEKTSWQSIIHELFHIQTKSQVTCDQHECFDSTSEFNNFLPLPLSKESIHQREISLIELIEEFTKEEPLNGSYYCQNHNQFVSAKQKTIICSPSPRVLIIQLKRFPFDGTNTKINTFVRYELEYEHLLFDNDRYQLCAVSVHVGTLAHGHYTTFAKNSKTQQWYTFNDSQCNKVTSRDVITKDAYILMYLKSDRSTKSIVV